MVVIACVLILFWLLASYHKAQQALQWWHGRQSMQLYQQAEAIRNELLQDSFILRRSLELSLLNHQPTAETTHQDWLKTMEKLHHALENLSAQITPPFIEDSLPLAIRHRLCEWNSHSSKFHLQLQLPTDWRHESQESSRVLLMALDELLRITIPELLTEVQVSVCLQQRRQMGELVVEIAYPDVATLTSNCYQAELIYLRQAFEFLTSGKCFHRRQGQTVTWYFYWKSSKLKVQN